MGGSKRDARNSYSLSNECDSTKLEVKIQCPLPLVAFEVLDGEGQSCAADRDRAHSPCLSRFQVPDFSVLDHKLVNDIHHLVDLK